MNQRALKLVAAADAADHVGLGDLDVGEADRRVAVGIVVGEGRVVDDLDPVERGVDDEEGRQPVGAVDQVRHHDVDRGVVAAGDEPLLAVDPEAGVGALGGGRDPRGIRAGVALGDRVGVLELAAQRRAQLPVDLLVGAVRPDVVGLGDVPDDRVGRAAVLLLDQRPLDRASSPGRRVRACMPAVEAGLDATPRLTAAIVSAGSLPPSIPPPPRAG